MDVRHFDLRIVESPLSRVQSVRQEIMAQFLETSTRYRITEVNALESESILIVV